MSQTALTRAKINARRLISGLLLAAEGRSLSATQVIRACALFGISENSVRVTLTRLSAEGRIESTGRGSYRLGPEARALGQEIGTWRRSEERLRPWSGDFVVGFVGALGRRDRVQVRRRERALRLLGFRELDRGLSVRPNNIERDVEAIRHRLGSLGLEREAAVFVGTEFSDDQRRAIDGLWDGEALNDHYTRERRRLEEWMKRASKLEPEVAARESYMIGSQAIRSIVFDPWLPAPFVDVRARQKFFRTVCRFDEVGRRIWSRFTAEFSHLPVSTPGST